MPNLSFFAIENYILEKMAFSYGKFFFASKNAKNYYSQYISYQIRRVFNYFNTHPIKNLINNCGEKIGYRSRFVLIINIQPH